MVQDNTFKFIIGGIIVYILYRDFFSKNREGYSRRYAALSGSNNIVLTDEKGNLSSIQFPKGIIVAWNGTNAPEGWAICDRSNGTPDLRGKFVLGMNPNSNKNNLSVREFGTIGGNEKTSFTMTVDQMPPHSHNIIGIGDSCNGSCNVGGPTGFNLADRRYEYMDKNIRNDPYIKNTGSGQPVTLDIIPPYYTLAYIMKL